jgi:LacI family transcriptional regulator
VTKRCRHDNSTGAQRFEGYKHALQLRAIPYSESLVVPGSQVDVNSERMGAEAMRLLLKRRPAPDGVFAYNDPLAIGAVAEILESGLRIPDDIAVIGCGNLHYDAALRIPLSSVDQKSEAIGQRTAEILLGILESKIRPQPRSVILEPSLAIRASSMKNPVLRLGRGPSRAESPAKRMR